ncbi:hypothetical protein CDAR_243241 [Caerostris darwini]|uniref:Uncharacterized protein n=1 Tax=Caerostris darwini TaxID=1538125 RepID=A0AAV4MP87_9ARAC|nr:hypothetical protein CDAR_243241 [Caerostris darwini]
MTSPLSCMSAEHVAEGPLVGLYVFKINFHQSIPKKPENHHYFESFSVWQTSHVRSNAANPEALVFLIQLGILPCYEIPSYNTIDINIHSVNTFLFYSNPSPTFSHKATPYLPSTVLVSTQM